VIKTVKESEIVETLIEEALRLAEELPASGASPGERGLIMEHVAAVPETSTGCAAGWVPCGC
jgi:hypothetical protein